VGSAVDNGSGDELRATTVAEAAGIVLLGEETRKGVWGAGVLVVQDPVRIKPAAMSGRKEYFATFT
jgi:hypothetical protein